MPDGTIKQTDPFTGTSVWTVPRRGNRPLAEATLDPQPLDPAQAGRYCAFCAQRYHETPPEKARIVRSEGTWRLERAVPVARALHEVAEFRRIPNLFEIVSYDYWHTNYGYLPSDSARQHQDDYLSDQVGRRQVLDLLRVRLLAEGMGQADWARLTDEERLQHAVAFFAGCHDVIVARRHFVEGAQRADQLASCGSLSPDEHEQYIALTVDALRDLYTVNRYARYVAVFQNWLTPAGASFDHLHKQLVAVDDRGARTDQELALLRTDANLYNERAVNYAARQNLLLAENEHAVAFAGFGHRYPSLELYSKSAHGAPWHQDPAEIRGMSDLLHALHAATGAEVACNEEWHHRPPDVDLPMPWRIVLKWRVSTLAGFEGGTKIYLNTIDPWSLVERVVPRLERLRGKGSVATNIAIGRECPGRPNPLRYNPALH